MAVSTAMLTASCKRQPPSPVSLLARQVRAPNTEGHPRGCPRALPQGAAGAIGSLLFYIECRPVLDAEDRALGLIPRVHAIVLARAEMIVLGPFDGTTAQPLGVHPQVGQGSGELICARRPASRSQRGLDHH